MQPQASGLRALRVLERLLDEPQGSLRVLAAASAQIQELAPDRIKSLRLRRPPTDGASATARSPRRGGRQPSLPWEGEVRGPGRGEGRGSGRKRRGRDRSRATPAQGSKARPRAERFRRRQRRRGRWRIRGIRNGAARRGSRRPGARPPQPPVGTRTVATESGAGEWPRTAWRPSAASCWMQARPLPVQVCPELGLKR